jgi:very-short-patch-repair endonuclease
MTGPESKLWARLKRKQFEGLKFRRQHGIGPYIVDFFCPEQRLVIEVDGDTHGNEDQILEDKERDNYLQSLGLQVIRYRNDDVQKNLDGVLQDLRERTLRPPPAPPYEGGEKKAAAEGGENKAENGRLIAGC